MPYKRKAERERLDWMTLAEAVEHINAQENTNDGLCQLRLALGEGEIPVRWAAEEPTPTRYIASGPALFVGSSQPSLFSSDEVPSDPHYWDSVLIFLDGEGRVIDQSFDYLYIERDGISQSLPPPRPIRPRQLYLLKSKILEFWPLQLHTVATEKNAAPISKPRPASKEAIEKVLTGIYAEAAENPPNILTAEQRARKILGKASRKLIREVLSKPQFANLRRSPGKQSK
jgi:hypothetical protein